MVDRIGFSLHFIPRIGGRPIWGWLFVSDVALTAVVAVYGWPSFGGLYSPIGGFGPHRSRVAILPAIIAKWAHVIARIDYPLHFTPRIGGRPIWGWISVSDVALAGRGCSDSVPMVELGGHIFARR